MSAIVVVVVVNASIWIMMKKLFAHAMDSIRTHNTIHTTHDLITLIVLLHKTQEIININTPQNPMQTGNGGRDRQKMVSGGLNYRMVLGVDDIHGITHP